MSGSKPHITEPRTVAAGKTAITETIKHIAGKMGIVRGTRSLLKLNQKGGIDCQSCAWPDPDQRTLAEFCESGAKALADEGTKKLITTDFFREHSLSDLARKDEFWLNSQGRLSEPVVVREGGTHYEPIFWDEAFRLIAGELNSLDSPDQAIFYTSGRTSNEAAFLYQLFVRQFGTNNLPDCSNMCHESSSVALGDSIGIGKATVRLADFEQTDLIIVIGQNPGTNAPRMMTSLEHAKRAGARMIAINPLPEAGLLNFVNPNPQHHPNLLEYPLAILGNKPTPLANLHLPVKIGGDMAVLKGMMKILLERERAAPGSVFDHEFISKHTEGFDDLIETLDSTTWEDILHASGLSRGQITEAGEMFIDARRVITCWAMGITQHKAAVATIQDIANLHFLRGQIGRPGAGLCPVRGHSNVQGDRTMGIWEKIKPEFADRLEKEFGFPVPREPGFATVASITAMREERARVFFAMGGNFVSASPDSDLVFDALRKCRLTVHVITKLNRSAIATGTRSLILPCLGRSEIDRQAGGEQFVSTESTMLNVQMSKGILEPASEYLRSEPWIVAQLAKATLGSRTRVDWDAMAADYDSIRDAISRVVDGFEDYNTRVRVPGGFYLPNPTRERRFPTPSGRAKFTSSKMMPNGVADGRLLLTTIRSFNQFNTTIYGLNDRYRGIDADRRVILMNVEDMDTLGLAAGDVVDVTSYFDDGERHAPRFTVVAYPIPRGCTAAYFPEANPLVPVGSFAERSETPTSKAIVISVERRQE